MKTPNNKNQQVLCVPHGRAALPARVNGRPSCDLCVANAARAARGQYGGMTNVARLFPHPGGRAAAMLAIATGHIGMAQGWEARALRESIAFWQAEAKKYADLFHRRTQARAQYRAALTVLHRMHEGNQPLPTCEDQAALVRKIRTDIAATFAIGSPVLVRLEGRLEPGTFMGCSRYQGILIHTEIEGGLFLHVDADQVYGIDEPPPEDCNAVH